MDLERTQIVKLRGAKGVRLTCRHGSLWMTQEGVSRDDFLVPGMSQLVETEGTVVIEAMVASSVTIDPASVPARAATRLEVSAA